jgi:hypothetical protein
MTWCRYAGDAEVMRVITKLAEAAMKELQAASQAQGDGSLAGLPGGQQAVGGRY